MITLVFFLSVPHIDENVCVSVYREQTVYQFRCVCGYAWVSGTEGYVPNKIIWEGYVDCRFHNLHSDLTHGVVVTGVLHCVWLPHQGSAMEYCGHTVFIKCVLVQDLCGIYYVQ